MKVSERGRRRKSDLYLNRELSWLAFNERVLEEALDESAPLLERLKFAIITATNLDEFFMVRVAGLKHRIAEGDLQSDAAGLTPSQQLAAVSQRAHALVGRLDLALGEILPALDAQGLRIARTDELDASQKTALKRRFEREILPTLTPLAIDTARPFPMLSGLSLNLAVLLDPSAAGGEPRLAVVQVPGRLPRLVRLAAEEGLVFVLLEDVIQEHLSALFPGQNVRASIVFRVAHDAELDLDDEGGRDYVAAIEEELRKRRRSQVVRLEMHAAIIPELLQTLTAQLGIGEADVYGIRSPLDPRALHSLVDLPLLEGLREPPLQPLPALSEREQADLFARLDDGDVLLAHPYDSFDPIVAFVAQAARDPDVLAIKMTLYRTSGESPIVRALGEAAELGKQVTVLVELLARFDEKSNIRWARQLEEAGAHVIYGIHGFKTHAKACLVVRRRRDGIRRYVHLGTGNYNDRTARLYADCGLLTADTEIGEDASAFFNALTGYSDPPRMRKLVMAPTGLRDRLLRLIDRERRRAEAGQAALIRAKMNSLGDRQIIKALYDASSAGVRVRLNVRGICCLRPGTKGASERIEVVSIIDRFLEHARIFHFMNGGEDEVYLSSADWMPRNLDHRIELLFPIESPDCRRKVLGLLDAAFADNVKARVLQSDGAYRRRRPARGEEPFQAQLSLYREYRNAIERRRASAPQGFEPVVRPSTDA
jgi:polyphosphate kinase